MLAHSQQLSPAIMTLCSNGLSKLLQQQLAASAMLQQCVCSFHTGTAVCSDQEQQQPPQQQKRRRAWVSRITEGRARPKAVEGYRGRLPLTRKYAVDLRDKYPEAFEQMRLIVGYYDLPENRHKPKPPPPKHVMISNLQTLRYTHDADPYYKLALLSYRSKLENMRILKGLERSQAFLQKVSAPPEFIPNLEGLGAATAENQQQQQ